MQTTLHLSKKWRNALSRCLISKETYETESKSVVDYYITDDPEKMESFLKVLEQVLKHKQTVSKNKFYSLMLLKDASERLNESFARVLSKQEELSKIVYQIAITEPFISSPSELMGHDSHPNSPGELLSNKSIKLAIECLLFWRLHYGDKDDETGKIFKLLHQKAAKNGVKFPKTFNFFNHKLQKDMKEVNVTESIQNSPMVQTPPNHNGGTPTSKDRSPRGNGRTPSRKSTQQGSFSLALYESGHSFSSFIDRKAGLAELEAGLVGLRQTKIEEGRTYVQDGLLDKPSELRDRFITFITDIKQSLQTMNTKASAFTKGSPNRNEKQVLQELLEEEQALKFIEDYVQENFLKFHRNETKHKVFEYLCVRSSLNTEEQQDSDSGSEEASSYVENGSVLEHEQHKEAHEQHKEEDEHRKEEETLLDSPFTKQIQQEDDQKIENSKMEDHDTSNQTFSLDKHPSEPKYKETNEPDFQSRNLHYRNPKLKLEIQIPDDRLNIGRLENSSNLQTPESFSSHILMNMSCHNLQSNVGSPPFLKSAGSGLREVQSTKTPKRFHFQQHTRELSEIAQSITLSKLRSKIDRTSITSRIHTRNRGPPTILTETTTQDSADGISTARHVNYNLHIDFSKEIQELKFKTSMLQQENAQLQKQFEEIKLAINRPNGNPTTILIDDTAQDEYQKTESSITPALQSRISIDEGLIDKHSKGIPTKSVEKTESIEDFSNEWSKHTQLGRATSGPTTINGFLEGKMHLEQRNTADPRMRRQLVSTDSGQISHYETSWASAKSTNLAALKKRLVVKGVMAHMNNVESSQQEKLPENSIQSNIVDLKESKSLPVKLGQIVSVQSTPTMCFQSNSEESMSSANSQTFSKSRTEEAKNGLTQLKKRDDLIEIEGHPLFRELEAAFGDLQTLNMFKRAGLEGKGCIFDNGTITAHLKITRLEDTSSNRRLLKVCLKFENKGQAIIENLAIKIVDSQNLVIIRGLEQNKTYIKPSKQSSVDFVVGVGKDIAFSHMKINFTGHMAGDGGNGTLLNFDLLVPMTYFLFFEGIRQLQQENPDTAWSKRKDLLLKSSGKFKINKDVLPAKLNSLKILHHSGVTTSSCQEKSSEYCETYMAMVETDNLEELLRVRLEFYPNSNEMVIKTASTAKVNEKAVFLLQTLLFLAGL